jgi:hypothetical protein
MMLSIKALGKHFGLLTVLVAALVIACTGVVLAQNSTTTPGYKSSNTLTASSVAAQGGAVTVGSGSATAGGGSASVGFPIGDLENGGFENGSFGGWTRVNQPGGSGNWFVYQGTTSPLSGHTIAAPPAGRFAATTDQGGPGSHVLYRDIKLRRGMTHKLSFYLYYRNLADDIFTRNTLDYRVEPNQQYRVDILKPTASPFTVNPDAILATLFRTKVGDPNRLAPKRLTFDLTRFAGQTVRLRFAEVDNQFYFLASVDQVRVTSKFGRL